MLNTVGTRLGEKINDCLFGGWPAPDYDEQDKKNEWQIYQAAFLIHDMDPPAYEALEKGEKTRPPEVEESWRKLHHERETGEIETTWRHGAEFIKKRAIGILQRKRAKTAISLS